MRRLICVVCLLAAVPFAAGCGDDDGGGGSDDEQAVRDVIVASLTTDDVEGDCQEYLSDGLIERTYVTRERCVRIQREEDETPADSVEFSSVEVDGDAAVAEFSVSGGEVEGAKGGFEMIREEGDWRIDEVSVALLRSLVEAGLRADTGQDLPPGAEECMADAMQQLSDPALREFAYALIGHAKDAQRRTFEILADCKGESGDSLLREVFVGSIRDSLAERGVGKAQVECGLEKLNADLSDEDLAALLSAPDANDVLGQQLVQALESCG